MEGLRQIMVDLLVPEKAAEATKRIKGHKDILLPSLMQITLHDKDPQVRQMAAVILRKETSKRFKSLGEKDQERLKETVIQGFIFLKKPKIKHF